MVKALINIYNDCQFVSACIESIKTHVDEIIVADGAYELYYRQYKQSFPDAKPWSTDGSIEIIKALSGLPSLTFLRCKKPWTNQVVKRTALVDAVPDGEWFLQIDADEMLVGKVDEGFKEIMESGCIAGRVPLVNLGCDIERLHYFWHPRIWRKESGMHFALTHWQLRDKYGRIAEVYYPVWWTQHFVMVHFKPLKPIRRAEPHMKYMETLRNRGWIEPMQLEIQDESLTRRNP